MSLMHPTHMKAISFSDPMRKILWLWLAGLALASAPLALAKKDGPTLVIRSNIKMIVISRDGVILGNENSPITIAMGDNAVEIAAKDYVARVIHVAPTTPTQRIVLQVNLVRSPPSARATALQWELPKSVDKAPAVAERPSICKARPVGADFVCPRSSLDDDIAFSGLVWNNFGSLPKGAEGLLSKLSQETLLELSADEKVMQDAETLWARTPGHAQLNALMGRLYMYRGECARIVELLLENQRGALPLADTKLLSALCYERTARPEIGLALLERHFDKIPKTPQLYYHRIRRLLGDYSADAKKLVVACTREFPSYYPCYEMWAFLETSGGKSSMNVRHIYLNKNLELQKKGILGVARLKRSKKLKDAYAEAIKQMQIHHLSFEFTWLTAGLEKTLGLPVNASLIKEKSRYLRILNRPLAAEIIGDIAAMDKGELLALAYRSFVKEYPKEMVYWMNLVKLNEANGDCPAVVALAEESYPFLVARDRYKMSLWEGLCLVKLERFDDAVVLYRRLTGENALLWSGFYNLGAVYERLGDKKQAMASFKQATEKRPPPQALTKLLDKIAYYEKHGVGAPDEDDESGDTAMEITTQGD